MEGHAIPWFLVHPDQEKLKQIKHGPVADRQTRSDERPRSEYVAKDSYDERGVDALSRMNFGG